MHSKRFQFSPNHFVLISIAAYTILFFVFFPAFFFSIDEHEYLKNAILLQAGQIKNADVLDFCGGTIVNNRHISTYHIGKSVFLIPFTWIEFPFAMVSGLFIHLLNTILFFLILRKNDTDTRFSILFLLLPVFVWSSRTLYSESLALTLLLAGTFLYLEKKPKAHLFSGLLFGLAAFVRYETVLISTSFALACAWKERRQWKNFLKTKTIFFVAGGAVAGMLLLLWNNFLYGNPFSTQFGVPTWVVQAFAQPLFLNNLFLFVVILLVAYPLLLASPLLAGKNLQAELLLSSLFTLLLFAQYNNISVFEFFSPLTVTARLRYLIPLMGLLLITYSSFIEKVLNQTSKRFSFLSLQNFFLAAISVLLFGAFILSLTHQPFLEKRIAVQRQLFENIPDNALVIGSSDDCMYFLKDVFGNRKYVPVSSSFIDLNRLIDSFDGPIFVMRLQYSNRSDSAVRQNVINAEREKIDFFLTQNPSKVKLVFETEQPHFLSIFSWKDQRSAFNNLSNAEQKT